MKIRSTASASAVGALLLLLFAAPVAAQQRAAITGQVLRADGGPLEGAHVSLEGTGYSGLTDAEGRYRIVGIRPGTYNVIVQFVGYAQKREGNVTLGAGEIEQVNFTLSETALRLQEIVVSGVADPIEGIRTPFSVSRISMEKLPVPASNPVNTLRGRVAGARVVQASGMPGSGVDIRLRARRGVNTSDTPLLVVDGVVQKANLVDLDAMDIESVEVLKGAAAASLYGSRAQAGVVEIRTRRGREVASGQTRITMRSEFGRSFLSDMQSTATAHPYLMDDNCNFVDSNGSAVPRVNRVIRPDRMVLSPYSGCQLYNHLELFFDPGRFTTNTFNIAQNAQSTNFFGSFADSREAGVVPDFNDGYHRQNLRLNLDHRVRSDLTVGFTVYASRSSQQNLAGANPFFALRFIAPDIDLTRPNVNSLGEEVGPYIIAADSAGLEDNPLYSLWANDSRDYRQRMQGNVNVRYSPFSWITLDGLLAYDRSDRELHYTRPGDYLTSNPDVTGTGFVIRDHDYNKGINGHLQGTLIRAFGDLTARTRIRWNVDRSEGSGFTGRGDGYIVQNVPTINNMEERTASGAEFSFVRQEGFMVNTGLDFRNKLNGDFLIRRDGSSRFGPGNRWHTYYRASLSYLMTEEAWWPIDFITAFKPRYSIGTAGSEPGFAWQYETWSVGSSGPSKGTLGNRNLAPEKTTEHDIGLDMIFNNRVSLELSYARSIVEDQLVPVPLPSYYGYSSQWQNAGEVQTRSYEATLEAQLIQTPSLNWNMGLIADKSNSWLSDWQRTCYKTSNFYRCQGENFSTMRLPKFMTDHSHLPATHAGSHDQWQVNDDGYLVPVGSGNTYRDGMAKNLWGTVVTIDGVDYSWGHPVFIMTPDGLIDDLQIVGDANPKFNLGWTNRLNWGGLVMSSLVDAKIGGDVYNQTAQWPYRDNVSPDQVQTGKADELKKPIDYYATLYSTNRNNSHFVEDGSYLKFRELSLGYRVGRDQLQRFLPLSGLGMNGLFVNVIGRNLFTWTNYSGIDPEVGTDAAGGVIENPVDSFGYPNFRQFTLSVEVQF